MPTNPEIEEIVRGLTADEYDGIARAFENGRGGMSVAFSSGARRSLCKRGFAVVEEGQFWPSLTQLGLSVRDHIMKEVKP